MSIALPTEASKPVTELGKQTILLYGSPKLGKSSFASKAPGSLFFECEPGLNHLEVFKVPTYSWEAFLEACKLVAKGDHNFKTIVIDMVSNAFLARRDTIGRVRWDDEIKTYEHWEFFYRASHIEHLQIAVALDCSVVHDHVAAKPYGALRARPKFRRLGLRKHGFDSLRYPGGGIVHA
jgi:hypothetical protein